MRKKVFISLMILGFYAIQLFPQDIINPPVLPNIENDNTHIYRGSLGFIKGWNWGSCGARLDSALGINLYHNMYFGKTDYAYRMNVITQLDENIVGGRNSDNIFNALSLYLEPTLIVDSTDNFKGRAGDNTGAVFGS